jgi:hypothetical protein
MRAKAGRQAAKAERKARVERFHAMERAEAERIQAAGYHDLPRLHSNGIMMLNGPLLRFIDTANGRVPALHWDIERGEYLTKDGRTMAQVAEDNQRR